MKKSSQKHQPDWIIDCSTKISQKDEKTFAFPFDLKLLIKLGTNNIIDSYCRFIHL